MSGTPVPGPSGTEQRRELAPSRPSKPYRGLAMEGFVARWYARTRGTSSQREDWRDQALALVQELPPDADVLEVAPGPGYFAIEIARTGRARVTTLDISRTFVEIAGEKARAAGVPVAVRQGDAAHMPFPDSSFDLLVCQAAFKNFSEPQQAVIEFYRVLRRGGVARVQDMSHDASDAAIRKEVEKMQLGGLRAFLTRRALRGLRRCAYTRAQFEQFARTSSFLDCAISSAGIGLDVRLTKPLTSPTEGERPVPSA